MSKYIFIDKIRMYFLIIKKYIMYGGIGEVVNTPDCGSGMQGFDPLISPHNEIKQGVKLCFFCAILILFIIGEIYEFIKY